MNNLKKVGLTALAGALVSVSANAADLSVTGGAALTFTGEEKTAKGNGWTMTNGVTFSASVEQEMVGTSLLSKYLTMTMLDQAECLIQEY
jgi:hypothetical protein